MNFTIYDQDSATMVARLLRPPRQCRGLLDFCHTMQVPDGPRQGDFLRPETEPAQLHFVKMVDSGRWSRFVYVAPSQRGKTTVGILAPWMHAIAEKGLAVGYVMPNLDKIAQNWEGKIKPAIVGSGFGGWLPTKGPGSKGGRPAALLMTNTTTGRAVVSYFMAGGTGARETSLSSVSPAVLVVDEADDFEDSGQIELALRRLESWGSKGRAFIASTINTRGEREGHPILDFFSRSDATASRVAHRCQHCNTHQVVEFEQLNLENGRIACSKCGVLWTDSDRHMALEQSKIHHANPDARTYGSLLTTCFDYHMGDFSSIAPSFIAARDKERLGDYSMMQTFAQKVLCRPYTTPIDHETVTDRALTLKSAQSKHEKGVVPADCERLGLGVDVQGDRIYWVLLGAGKRDRRWIIDNDEWFWTGKDEHTGRPIEPSEADRHAVLDRLLTKARDGWPREDGTVVKVSFLAIDIGYNPNGSIGRWCCGKAGIVPVRGDHENRVTAETLQGKVTANLGKHNSTLVTDHGFYEVRKQEHSPGQPGIWWFVKSQSMREHTAARLRLPYDADGSLNIYHGLPERDFLVQHLSSWAIVREPDSKIAKWVQVRRRDDYFDCTNYATAILSQAPKQSGSRSAAGSITA
jgi:phage terminase large subunit GpA-like protein